jgi:hypothetical protein
MHDQPERAASAPAQRAATRRHDASDAIRAAAAWLIFAASLLRRRLSPLYAFAPPMRAPHLPRHARVRQFVHAADKRAAATPR